MGYLNLQRTPDSSPAVDSVQPVLQRELQSAGQTTLMTAQSESKVTPSLFSADTLFPDPFKPEPELELSDIFDENIPEEVGEALNNSYMTGCNLMRGHEASYERKGEFFYIMPDQPGKNIASRWSAELSEEFGQKEEAVRSEAMKYFTLIQSNLRDAGFLESEPFVLKAFTHFVEGVHQSVKLEQAFKAWEREGLSRAGLPESDTELFRLMIEGSRCGSASERFRLNNECGYLERCYRGFFELLNQLAAAPEGWRLSISDINRAAAIVGTTFCDKSTHYAAAVKAEDVYDFCNVMTPGNVCMDSEGDDIFKYIKPQPDKQSADKIRMAAITQAREYLKGHDIDIRLEWYKVVDDYLMFKVRYNSDDKQRDGQAVLDHYYRTVAEKKSDLEIVEAAVEAACMLQRMHLYTDGNGRIQFFMVLSVLLYQQGFWLKRTLDDPWFLVDSAYPETIARMLLPLCEKRPVFTTPIDWRTHVSGAENVRLLCAMGETEAFKEAIHQRPELLSHTFRPNDLTLLGSAVLCNQESIVEYILNRYPDRVSSEDVCELIRLLDQSNFSPDVTKRLRMLLTNYLKSELPSGDGVNASERNKQSPAQVSESADPELPSTL